ncbi:hypothetical protein M0805_001059 [Coniferiporia weirii]|nr:hypothetical protein M0805_001059 [Coniferiporia weirii]
METFETRLRSFSKPKSKSAKSAWPHPQTFSANPKSLAEAGFHFKPSKAELDNVQCFLCKKELGGWDEEDNPFEIHIQKCPKCPWAIARCSLEFDVDSDGNFSIKDPVRLPSNKVLEKARLDTFGGKQKWWPHDSVRNHGATSKKMAKAGFVYTPQAPGDDTATCFYCDLSLSGWDAEDDPIEEHHKREARSSKACPFFQTEIQPPRGIQKTGKATSRKSRAVKSTATTPLDDSLEDRPLALPNPTGKKGKQKQSHSVASSAETSDYAKSVKTLPIQNGIDESEDLKEDDDPTLKVKPTSRKSTRKAPASRAKAKSVPSSAPENQTPATIASSAANAPPAIIVPPAAAASPEVIAPPVTVIAPPVTVIAPPVTDTTTITDTTAFQASVLAEAGPSPLALFLPLLATAPFEYAARLTDAERAMTVEQWIRHEMAYQHDRLRADGEHRIAAFRTRAAEVRARIEAL